MTQKEKEEVICRTKRKYTIKSYAAQKENMQFRYMQHKENMQFRYMRHKENMQFRYMGHKKN